MIRKKEKAEKRIFGFFKKKQPAPPSPSTNTKKKPVQDDTLNALPKMAEVLVHVLEEKLPVRVFFGHAQFAYYSHLEWELVENEVGLIINSKMHLEQGKHLLLAPLDPPIGNLKIRSESDIRVEFFTTKYLIDCVTNLKQITGNRKIRLDFPEKMLKQRQKRTSFRAPVNRSSDVILSVVRPSGIAFEAKLSDLSVGGAAFYPTGATPKIFDGARVIINVTYPEGKLAIDTIILGSVTREKEQSFRAQFLVADHKTATNLEALVTYVQRQNLQTRKKTFQ